ncbi:MAG: TorF family putative porin [Akkermansiaceae bacterium]
MKNTIKSIIIGGGLMAASSLTASAEVEYEVYAGYHSAYEFRGVNFGDDMFDAGFELSTELGGGISLTAGAWYQDSDGNTGVAAFDELDLYLELSKSFGSVDVSVGYISYIFPGTQNVNTDEVYVGLSTELESGIGFGLTYYHDTNEIDGGYLEFEVTKSYEINPCVSLDISAGAAWSFGYNRDVTSPGATGDLDGFNHFFAGLALPWEVRENFTLTPYIKYIAADSDLANDANGAGTAISDDFLVGGISLSYSF